MRATAKRTSKAQSKSLSGSLPDPQTLKPRSIFVWSFLLSILTVGVYYPAILNPFINYDDGAYVTENSHVQAGLSLETISWAFTSTQAANWHPVTWISHALDCDFYGLDPHGHHLTSVILHAANVALLFLCLCLTTRAPSLSAMAAALFALHPFNVESVAWVAERKNVLSTFFFLLTLVSYGRYARRPSTARYLTLCLLFLLGLAAKPMLVTLPFVLLLLDYWPLARIKDWTEPSKTFPGSRASLSNLLIEKAPLLALAAGSCVITVMAQGRGNAEVNLGDIPLSLRIGNAVYSYAKYIQKVFWPVNMAVFYPHPLDKLTFFQIGLSATFLLAISFLVGYCEPVALTRSQAGAGFLAPLFRWLEFSKLVRRAWRTAICTSLRLVCSWLWFGQRTTG